LQFTNNFKIENILRLYKNHNKKHSRNINKRSRSLLDKKCRNEINLNLNFSNKKDNLDLSKYLDRSGIKNDINLNLKA